MTTNDARPWMYALVAALAVYAFGRCDGTRAADLGWHERNVATLTKHVRTQRAQLATAIAASDAAGEDRADASAAVDAAQDTLADARASARAALADTAATAATLRRALGRTEAAAHGLSLRVDVLQSSLAREVEQRLAERAGAAAVIATQAKTIKAQAKQIRRLTPSPLRRLWAVTCTATFAGTGAAVGALLPAPPAPFLGAALGVAVSEGVCR